MAIRYSGELTLRVTLRDDDSYKVNIAHNGRHLDTQVVRPSPCLRRESALDSPEAFDAIAHAGLSFSEHDDIEQYASFNADFSGWHIARSKAAMWGEPIEPHCVFKVGGAR